VAKYWQDIPILSWAMDEKDIVKKACEENGLDLNNIVEQFDKKVFQKKILPLLTSTQFKMNLGGASEKSKLIAIDKPTGVFNFSLASKGLYHLQEYYSEELAKKDPNRFSDIGLLSGLIPSNLVDSVYIGGEKKFLFRDKEKGNEYYVVKRNMGQTAIDDGIPDAKYKYASRTKKVYQTYKRKGGKVRYVEIHSLFYFTRNDFVSILRHFPALMVANYLESVGIKTRVYMTRFVLLGGFTLKKQTDSGIILPMGNTKLGDSKNNNFVKNLLIQPIIAKDFMEEADLSYALCIPSESYSQLYESCAKYTFNKETENPYKSPYGDPEFSQQKYWEAVERYRGKYKEYVDLGIFKSKEVSAESMIYFNDQSIESYLQNFISEIRYEIQKVNKKIKDEEVILIPMVNRFFTWWMNTSANTIKHKVSIFNSNSYKKDFLSIIQDLQNSLDELKNIINESKNDLTISDAVKSNFDKYGYKILQTLNIVSPYNKNEVSGSRYMNAIISEITTYADGEFYPTSEESVEKMDELKLVINNELKNL